MASRTLALHCQKMLLGNGLQLDGKKSGTSASPLLPDLWRQGVASILLTHNTHSLRRGGSGEEEARVLWGAALCDCSRVWRGSAEGAPKKVCTRQPAMVLYFPTGQGPI